LRVVVVEVDSRSGLPALFGRDGELGYEEEVLLEPGAAGPGSAELRARTLTPDEALLEYLEDRGLRRISRRLMATGTLDVVATAVPGIKEILVLGKVKQMEARTGPEGPDCIVVDAPAAGHAVSFLSSPHGLLDAAAAGPIRAQAADVVALLSDPARCQVMLVTVPEETPVNEAVDTAFHLEDRAAVMLAPVVVNGIWDRLDLPEAAGELGLAPLDQSRVEAAARFRHDRQTSQQQQLQRLAERLPLAQIRLPYLFTTDLGVTDLQRLAWALRDQLPAPSTP
jgi:anion-transporting  ArsA/GET3 family ATPase